MSLPQNAPLPLTFGVEIEALLAMRKTTTFQDYFWFEYMEYIRDQLISRGINAHAQRDPNQSLDYTKWNVTEDSSIKCPDELLEGRLSDRIAPENQAQWTCKSLELVSRPLQVPNTQLHGSYICNQPVVAEIKICVEAVIGTRHSPHGAFTNEECGLHIHIGMPPQTNETLAQNPCIPLPVLKYLAFLLIRYEALLTTFQPYHRNPLPKTQASAYCQSNRIAFLVDGHTCHDAPLEPISDIRDRIFHNNTNLRRLCYMMGSEKPLTTDFEDKRVPPRPLTRSNVHPAPQAIPPLTRDTPADSQTSWSCGSKYKIVRWALLVRDPTEGPRTLEFRQPRGTLDPEEIGYTVHLYTSLVRAAERLANNETTMIRDDQEATLANLFDLLALEPPMRAYWTNRQQVALREAELACRTTDLLSREDICEACAQRLSAEEPNQSGKD